MGLSAGGRWGPTGLLHCPPTEAPQISDVVRHRVLCDVPPRPKREPALADTNTVAFEATTLPSPEDLERVRNATREPFVLSDEALEAALGPQSPRRLAFDEALAELDAGLTYPSVACRQRWSLLLGLERLLGVEEPTLVDGTVLSAHQVDALSGTLTALLAEAQRTGANGSDSGR